MSTGWDWKALAETVLTSRQALGWTQETLADRAATNVRTVVLLESGEPRTRLPVTLGRIESALGWGPGDGLRVLKGVDASPKKSLVTAELTKSNLRVEDVDSLQSELDYTDVTVSVGRLRRLLAELALLRERLALYEPLPEIEKPDNDCPF